MWRMSIVVFAAFLCLPAQVRGTDLSQIDRTIRKLPPLQSKTPEYCLLVFGPRAAKRVWLVHDCDVLYVDRNGNGDLTDPGERVAADPLNSKPADGVFYFHAGDIPDRPHSPWTAGGMEEARSLERDCDGPFLADVRSTRS